MWAVFCGSKGSGKGFYSVNLWELKWNCAEVGSETRKRAARRVATSRERIRLMDAVDVSLQSFQVQQSSNISLGALKPSVCPRWTHNAST